ncbi:mannose-1-phosphate guanylyltransferase [Pararhodonellum marinum]|uniref:mannose-1-phosphate guanylyltransferase n=1 Tax=Pararhodonellum marinum TaxID=2755358 RepID=UPI00188DFB26|nr:mannose-1-phosphate guanylyltransferase [Pararhodonellum marinum]
MSRIVNVILSGGIGSRLWPLSRKSCPKQYLEIFEGKSLFELTVSRNKALSDLFLVVGNKDNYLLSRACMEKAGVSDFQELVEATPRNTAAAIAFAAFDIKEDDLMLICPSDQLIGDPDLYQKSVQEAVDLAKKGNLVTFGLLPTRAETGFGYIESQGNDVISFREKPNKEQAEAFLASGNFLWNSGMFCFQAKVYLEALKQHAPEVYATAKSAYEQRKDIYLPMEASMEIPSISIDYAVMEKSNKIKVVPSAFSWSDMGSFEALYDHIPENSLEKSGSNLALNSDKKVVFLGVENIIFVETADAILILDKGHAQEVKKIYEKLEKEDPKYLD